MKEKIMNWLASLYLRAIIRRAGGIDNFVLQIKNIDSVTVEESKNKIVVTHPNDKWSISVKTNLKKT